ncbi:MAG: YHYH protein, partial [Psychrosphaera sp.]|nr:YHYH protein [Psychrosphaera sp.]
NAGQDQSVGEQVMVTLNGVASADSDGNIVSYRWQQIAGAAITLADPELVSPVFTTIQDSGGESLSFELTVTDNSGSTDTDTVIIYVYAADPTAEYSYIENPDFHGQLSDAVLFNRDPDCRAYAQDNNDGDYGASQIVDNSNNAGDSESKVHIDMVIASNWNATTFNYDNVTVTTNADAATHCRMVSNMIPNHTFGVQVTGPNGDGWINPVDHSDTEVTYIPVMPVKTTTLTDTPRNPPIFDFDGILLNGVGISMDSGFCYNPGVTTGPRSLQTNAAGNTSGCGPQNSWFELPAYSISDPSAENMAAVFDDYFAHAYVGTYHYHAMTHPLQEDQDQVEPPSIGQGSPVIGFAPDGFPIYGHWFVNQNDQLVKAQSGYKALAVNSRTPIATALHGTPPTPWDMANTPQDFQSDFGLEMGRYEEDWYYAGAGNLDECNGAFDVNGDYGYYITDTYPFTPPCTYGARDLSFGKKAPTL